MDSVLESYILEATENAVTPTDDVLNTIIQCISNNTEIDQHTIRELINDTQWRRQYLKGYLAHEVVEYGIRIGEGTTAIVVQLENRIYKFISPAYKELHDREVNILEKLSRHPDCNPHIACIDSSITTLQLVDDSSASVIVTIGGYGEVMDLLSYRNQFEMDHIRIEMARQLILGLMEIHRRGICHRDIKPENIVVDTDTTTLRYIDFGVACQPQLETCPSIYGTEIYLSPESLSVSVKTRNAWVEEWYLQDVWALGATLYELFDEESSNNEELSSRDYPQLLLVYVSKVVLDPRDQSLITLIAMMLAEDTDRRPTIQQVYETGQSFKLW